MRKVVKFGGSSLANAQQFEKVAQIIKMDKSRCFVVPSAPGKRHLKDTKVTDLLYACYKTAVAGEDITAEIAEIRGRYEEIITGLKMDLSLDDEFAILTENFKNKAGEDYAASRGEYLNGIILAHYLGMEFVDAAEVIFFHSDGSLHTKKTNEMLAKRLKRMEHAVIPGFYGSNDAGDIITFSRGGSDITGSLVAQGLGVDMYENWTDVSGFLAADPRIIASPIPIETITYKELRELAYMGATVLHDEAIFPVREAGIPINIRNTNEPTQEGTLIVANTYRKPKYAITGIAGKEGFASITIAKAMMNMEVGFCRKVLGVFEKNNLSIEHMPSGIDTLTIFVHQEEFEEVQENIIAEIKELVNPDTIEVETDLALVAVVGRGMKSTRGTAARIFSALAHAHVNVKMIDQGSCELNIIIGVSNEDFRTSIQAIYDIFITVQL